ncbi:MAG: hypothetical protein F4Y37_08550 [Caldilineaceae bacterium SB0664_bin_22]|nr:hypothetical protein [Caldilineaceae bacterium SB0664_bin_22]
MATAHLGIGNGLHWMLDVVFWEDESYAPRNLCLLRHMVLNLLWQDTTIKTGVAIQRRTAARNMPARRRIALNFLTVIQ